VTPLGHVVTVATIALASIWTGGHDWVVVDVAGTTFGLAAS
jgi:hypothetical protein